jgi:hypothetical protein
MRSVKSEHTFDQAALAARAHDGGVRAAAKQQPDRVDDDGFPGAGLACEYREARTKRDVELVDDGEIADTQLG